VPENISSIFSVAIEAEESTFVIVFERDEGVTSLVTLGPLRVLTILRYDLMGGFA
jgi:hypothetical protein